MASATSKAQLAIDIAINSFAHHRPQDPRTRTILSATVEQCVIMVALFRKSMPKDWVITGNKAQAVEFTIPGKEGRFLFTSTAV